MTTAHPFTPETVERDVRAVLDSRDRSKPGVIRVAKAAQWAAAARPAMVEGLYPEITFKLDLTLSRDDLRFYLDE